MKKNIRSMPSMSAGRGLARHFIRSSSVAVLTVAASAAVIDISGNLETWGPDGLGTGSGANINTIVGTENSARLVGDTRTSWHGVTTTIDIDLNGHELMIHTGGGNTQNYNGAFTGGILRLDGHNTGDPNTGGGHHDIGLGGSSANSFTNVIMVRGLIRLEKDAGVDALSGSIEINTANAGWGTKLSWLASDQINDASVIDSAMSSGAFQILLNGHTEFIAGLSLGTGHTVDTGIDGILTVGSLSVDGISFDPGTYTEGNSPFVLGSGSLVVIPEPSAALLGGIGLLALLKRRRKS